MSRGRPRWPSRDLRHRFPLERERQPAPRFDGCYVDDADGFEARFAADGTVRFGNAGGTWTVDDKLLRITTSEWQCEGAIAAAGVYLLCAVTTTSDTRAQRELIFRADL